MKRASRSQQSGFVFVTVVAFSALLFGITLSYVDLLTSEKKLVRSSVNSQRAEALAEAGLEEAFWEYNYGGNDFTGWSASGATRTKTVTGFTDTSGNVVGDYTVTVDDFTGSNPTITSVSSLTNRGGAATAATMRAQLRPRPEFTKAISAKSTVHFDSNAGTDSFDSTVGNYGGANIAENGDVVTNSTATPAITLDSNAEISGDAGSAAASGGMTPGDQTQVTGAYTPGSTTTIPNNDTKYASIISALQVLPDSGTLSSGTVGSNARYRKIDTNSNATITITGSVSLYLWDTNSPIAMDSNSDIVISPGASLTIYSAGEVVMDSNCDINLNIGSSAVSQFKLVGLSTCSSITMSSNTNIAGTISAPDADFFLDSNVDIYGAVIGDAFDIDSNAHVHYDENLEDSGSGTGTRLQWMRRSA